MALLNRAALIIITVCIALELAFAGYVFWRDKPPSLVSENPPKVVISQHETRPQPGKPRRITRPRPVNCRWVPAQAYQWPEGTVLSYAQQNYRLTPTQLRVLKYCVEHHHVQPGQSGRQN